MTVHPSKQIISNIRYLQDQGGFSPCHLGLEAALVETAPQFGAADSVLAYRDERGAALRGRLTLVAGARGDGEADEEGSCAQTEAP